MKRKILIVTLLTMLIIPCIGIFSHPIVYAEYNGAYDFHCSLNYEVSYINDDGSLSQVSCHSSYNDAKAAFDKLDGDYVIRNANSLSPTKIVAMKSGYVYSYPGRSGSITMRIYELPNFNTDEATFTYLTNHYQMVYLETYRSYNNGTGCIRVNHNGYIGYTDLEYTDLVPMKYIERGIGIWLGGNNTYEYESPFYVIPRADYYEVVQNGNYTDLKIVYHQMYPKKNSSEPVTYQSVIGPALSFMKTGEKYYSVDSYHFYKDAAMTDLAGTGVSYYQFLPLRSTTDVPAAKMNAYLASKVGNKTSAMTNTADIFVEDQNIYGMNALLVFAMGMHESAYGTHAYATKYYNFFGWSAFDANPSNATHYNDAAGAIRAHMGYNLTAYLDSKDWRHMSSSLGNKGSGINVQYASDPFWSVKIAAYAYDMDKYANDYNGNLTDYGKYTLAMVKNVQAEVKAQPKDSAKTLYKIHSGKSATYLCDYIVIVLGEENGYTKIQTTNAVNNGNIVSNYDNSEAQLIQYDFNASVGYIKTSDLVYLNQAEEEPVVTPGDYVKKLSSFTFENGVLTLSGKSYRQNIVSNSENAHTYLQITGTKKKKIELTETFKNDVISFKGNVDLTGLPVGTYKFAITTEYTEDSSYNGKFTVKVNTLPSSSVVGDKVYTFSYDNQDNPASKVVVLTIKEKQNDNLNAVAFVSNVSLSDGILSLSGYGFIQEYNFDDPEKISHEIVLYDYNDENNVIRYPAVTSDAENATQMSDGFNYQYTRFDVDIDLGSEDISLGNYAFKIHILNGTADAEIYLKAFSFDETSSFDERHVHRISANKSKNYRLELDEIMTPIDYTLLNKRSKRQPLVSYDSVSIDENGHLTMFGQAMMYYLQYDDPSHIETQVKLINEKTGAYIDVDTQIKACPISYTDILGSSRDLTYICFEVDDSVEGFTEGDYSVVVEMENTENDTTYYDVKEFTNYNSKTVEGGVFKLYPGDARNRLMLRIGGVHE